MKKLYVSKNGFRADWFKSGNPNGAALIVLGGSKGGNKNGDRWASVLTKKGYDVLSAAYFKAKGLPKQLELIPLEYVGNALKWIVNTQKDRKIGIIGASRGAELTLIEASLHPRFDAVIAISPTNVVWQSINRKSHFAPKSSWTLNGKPLPFLPYDFSNYDPTKGKQNIFNLYSDALNDIDDHKEAIINVENIQAPILLLSGGKDNLWPSNKMANMIVEHLKNHFFAYSVYHKNFPKMGHLLFAPQLKKAIKHHYIPKNAVKHMFKFLGGTQKAFIKNEAKVEKVIYKFLKKYLQ